jgi:hypothetical protein
MLMATQQAQLRRRILSLRPRKDTAREFNTGEFIFGPFEMCAEFLVSARNGALCAWGKSVCRRTRDGLRIQAPMRLRIDLGVCDVRTAQPRISHAAMLSAHSADEGYGSDKVCASRQLENNSRCFGFSKLHHRNKKHCDRLKKFVTVLHQLIPKLHVI